MINMIGNTPKDTQKKHGFVYSDISLKRAQNKMYEYINAGFKTEMIVKTDGYYYVVIR